MLLRRLAFEELLKRFTTFCPIKQGRRQDGRPPKFQYHHQVLGLLLRFYACSDNQSALCLVFGAPPAMIPKTPNTAERALVRALSNFHPARIAWPSPHRQVELAWLVEAREPLLLPTFVFIDGKNYRVRDVYVICVCIERLTPTLTPTLNVRHPQVQQPSQQDLRNALYNGWLHSVLVTGTLCFAADGCIVWDKHNCPNSWNDAVTSAVP